ncbi:hypothetical protein CVT24_010069 [Panaeolus cyanescens]|uniref:Uncharacterized protein n=1 Tax=Panaeolus cyanescens TaxID=181874 RepID=A0A409WLT7_9AGAR|nr:hypothetical protein CVT24_010069 [Panaeolus cyanescens]
MNALSCYCPTCWPGRTVKIRTCQSHLAQSVKRLRDSQLTTASGITTPTATADHLKFLTTCVTQTQRSIQRWKLETNTPSALTLRAAATQNLPLSTLPVGPVTNSHSLGVVSEASEPDMVIDTEVDRDGIMSLDDVDNQNPSSPSAIFDYENYAGDENEVSDDENQVVEQALDEGGEREEHGYSEEDDNNWHDNGAQEDISDNAEVLQSVWIDDSMVDISNLAFFQAPACVTDLRKSLLEDYTPLPKPDTPFVAEELTSAQSLSLSHYIAWRRTNGSVLAYNLHRDILSHATGLEILSLHNVRKLALRLAQVQPTRIDMCPRSCIAYTGAYKPLVSCPYVSPQSKKPCGEPRYKTSSRGKQTPRAQFTVMPVLASIRAMFANAETSRLLRYRDKCIQQVIKMAADIQNNPSQPRFSDFSNGTVHELHCKTMGLFQDERDIALALSSDGAQLTMKKQSNTWLLIIILLNLPPEIRYHARNVIINFATPGPNAPGDIESFIRPLFEELARAGEGIWIWDALDSSYFFHRAHAVMFNGDMLGSAKVNGMAGHSARYGDRFSLLPGARSSVERGAKSQYYPLLAPHNDKYNPDRAADYSTIGAIPIRQQVDYWRTLDALANPTLTQTARKLLVKSTGVSRMPLAVASPAFMHPSFFPLDPFHLFYENCMPFFYDLSTKDSTVQEAIYIPQQMAQKFGELVGLAISTIPPSFCGPVRDPFLKRQSQYKAYEWMALLHWYFIPIGIELGFDPALLDVFSQFAAIVDFAMTNQPRSHKELDNLQKRIIKFLNDYEFLYVAGDPEKIHRCRLCVFQLFHVPLHIRWYGSIRIGSQATVERSIGEIGRKINSRKEPFANLTNIIVEQEVIRMLQEYYPHLASASYRGDESHGLETHLSQNLRLPGKKIDPCHLAALQATTEFRDHYSHNHQPFSLKCFGKLRLKNGQTIKSRMSEAQLSAQNGRQYRWLEALISKPGLQDKRVYGESLAFYSVEWEHNEGVENFVVLNVLNAVDQPYSTVIRGVWGPESEIIAIRVENVACLVGIWTSPLSSWVYVLRKHPALQLLSAEERGVPDIRDSETYGEMED